LPLHIPLSILFGDLVLELEYCTRRIAIDDESAFLEGLDQNPPKIESAPLASDGWEHMRKQIFSSPSVCTERTASAGHSRDGRRGRSHAYLCPSDTHALHFQTLASAHRERTRAGTEDGQPSCITMWADNPHAIAKRTRVRRHDGEGWGLTCPSFSRPGSFGAPLPLRRHRS